MKLLESIWNKEKSFTSEINYKTLEGDEFAALISIPFPETKLEQHSVPVTIQSIEPLHSGIAPDFAPRVDAACAFRDPGQ